MKKRKILYLFPLAALVLSGCTFEEGWNTTKTWVSDHIWTPILNLFGGKKSSDSDKKQDGGNTPAPSTDSDTEEIVATEVGSVDNPLSVTEFQALCDANLEYDGLEEGKSATDFAHIAYVTAKVSSNTWNTEGTKIQYLNLVDKDNSSLQITGMFVIVDASVTGDYSAKDSLKGLEVVVKGYPALYNKKGSGKTYELVSKDKSDTENPRLMKVIEAQGTPGVNYGSLEAPLTVSEAKAVIDQENPTAIKMYVQGEVKSNEAWSSQYSNIMRITLTDGANDIVVFKCATFPADVTKESITANSLVGLTALAYGLGELYQSTTYELTAPSIISFSGEVTPPTPVDNFGTLDNPLSIAEAKAVIDAQNPTTQEMYVTGTVKSNTAWSTQYNNVDIVLTDDQGNEFTVWRTATLPDSLQPTADQLVGKVVIAHGTGKLYNSTYELDQGCVVDSIEDAAPIVVESVVLSSEEHIDLQKGQSVKITASVLPAQASQEVEWSLTGEISRSLLSGGPATYDTETNILTAVDTGEATLTATSVADGTVSASCTIEITEATRELSGIEIIESEPKLAYNAGEEYGHEGLTVQASYDNGEKADVTDLVEWSYSKATAEVGDDELVVTATYEENEVVKTDSVTLQVTVSEQKGTIDHPYSVSEAYAIFQDLADGATTAEVYVEGYINSKVKPLVSSGRGQLYLTDGVCATDLYLYNVNNVGGTNDLTAADLPVGGYVKASGVIKNYGGTFEVCWVQNSVDCKLAQAVTAPVITSVGSPVGPEEVSLNGSIAPINVSVPVVYSGIVEATVQAATVTGDFSTAGPATAYVTIDGWEDTLSFQVTVVSGTVLVETEVYKLDGTDATQGSNGYATDSEVTQSGIQWIVTANTTISPWRFGGKNISTTDRVCKSSAAVTSDDVTKVVVNTGSATATVHSVSLLVGTSAGASDIDTFTVTTGLTNAALEFTRPEGHDWSGRFFSIVFNVTCGGSNQYIQLTSAQFYAMK